MSDGTRVESVSPERRLLRGPQVDGRSIQERGIDSLPFAIPVLPRPLINSGSSSNPFTTEPSSSHQQVKDWLKSQDQYTPLEVAQAWANHGPRIEERLRLISELVRQDRGIEMLRAQGKLPGFELPVTTEYVLATATMLLQIGVRQAEVQAKIKAEGGTEEAWLVGITEFNHLQNLRKELDRSVGYYFSNPPAPQPLPEPETGQFSSDQEIPNPPGELLIDLGDDPIPPPPPLPKPQAPPQRQDLLTGQGGSYTAPVTPVAGSTASDELQRDISDLKQKLDGVTHLLEGQGRQLTTALSREKEQQGTVRALHQRLDEQQGIIISLETECEEVRQELTAAQQRHEKQSGIKQGYIQELEKQLQDKENKLSEQLVKHSSDVDLLQKELGALANARQEAQSGLVQIEARAKELEQEKEDLEARLATAYDALLRVNSKRVDNLEALKEQDTQIAALKQSQRQLQQSARTLQATLDNTRKKLEESKQNYLHLDRFLGDTLRGLSTAGEDGSHAVKSLEKARLELDKVRNERALFEKAVAAKSKELKKALEKAELLGLERQSAVERTDLLLLEMKQSDEEKQRLREEIQGLSRDVSREKQSSDQLRKELKSSESQLRERKQTHVDLIKRQGELVQSLHGTEKKWYRASEDVTRLQKEWHAHEEALSKKDKKIADLREQLSQQLESSSLLERQLEENLHHEKSVVDHFSTTTKDLEDKCRQLEEDQRRLKAMEPEPIPEGQVSLNYEGLLSLQKENLEKELKDSLQREETAGLELESVRKQLSVAESLHKASTQEIKELAEEKKKVERNLAEARIQRGKEFSDRQEERHELHKLQGQHDQLKITTDKQRASLESRLQGSQQSEEKLRSELSEKAGLVKSLERQMHLMEIRLKAELMQSQSALHKTEIERDDLSLELVNQKTEYEAELKKLRSTQEKLASDVKDLSRERAKYLEEVIRLREEKSNADQGVSDKQEQLDAIQSQLNSAQTELANLRGTVESVTEDREAAKIETAAIKKQYEAVAEQTEKLSEEQQQKQRKYDLLQEELHIARRDLEKQSQEILSEGQKATQLLEEADSKVRQLEISAEKSGSELENLTTKLTTSESKSKKLESGLAEREKVLRLQEESYSRKHAEDEKRIKALELEVTSLSDGRDKLGQELAKSALRSAQLETKRRGAVAYILSLEAKVTVLEQRHEQQLDSLENEKHKLNEQLDSREKELLEQQSALETQKATLDSVQSKYSQANDELVLLKSQYSDLESSSTASASDLAKLKEDVRTKGEQVASFESQVKSLTDQLSVTEEKLSGSQLELKLVKDTVSSHKKELDQQRTSLLEAQQEVKESQRLLAEEKEKLKEEQARHDDYEKIKAKYGGFRDEYKKLRKQYKDARSKIQELRDSERALNKQKASLHSKVEELENSDRELEQTRAIEGDRHKEELAKATSAKERLNQELSTLNEQMASLKNAKAKVETEASTLRDQIQGMENDHAVQVKNLNQQVSDSRKQLDSLTHTHELLVGEMETLGNKAGSLESHLTDSRQKVKQLETQLSAEEGKVTAGKKVNEETQRALKEEQLQVAMLFEQVRTVQDEKKVVQTQVGTLAEEVEQLKTVRQQLEELQTALDKKGSLLAQKEKRESRARSAQERRRRNKRDNSTESGFQSDSSSSSASSRGVSPGRQKHFLFKTEIRDRVGRLNSIDKDDMNVGIALVFDRLLVNVQKAESNLYRELEAIDKQDINSLPVSVEHPPSLEESRQAKIRHCEEFSKFLAAERTKFVKALEDNDDNGEDIIASVDDLIESVGDLAESIEEENNDFVDYRNRLESVGWKTGPEDSLSVASPEAAVDKALVGLRSALRTSPGEDGQEKRAYATGAMAREMHKLFVMNGKRALEDAKAEPDQVLMELERQRQALSRLLPENLPLDMESQIPPIGQKHLSLAVKDAIVQLEAAIQDPLTELGEVTDPRGVSGAVLARRLIYDPDICPSVVALLGSLQSTHGGIEKTADEYDYYQASSVGLKRIRDEHGLVDMPTMQELLRACEEDLKRPGSVLLAEAVRQHHGQYKTSDVEKTRRKKLSEHCQKLLQNMEEVEGGKPFRDQSTREGDIAVHPHRSVLDCFVPGKEGAVVKKGDTFNVRGPYSCYPLPPDNNGLFNAFFDRAGGAELSCNTQTGNQYLQLTKKDCIPADVIFKSKGRDWQVELDQTTWTVHPGFLLDHPNFVVPFEAEESGALHRDWLPVRDFAGNTALLVLRKTPRDVRYFLYEMGKEQVLKPRLIGPDYSDEERREAEFLSQAACATVDSKATGIPPAGRLSEQVADLKGANRNWLKCPVRQLQEIHTGINSGATHQSTVPLTCSPPTLPLSRQRVQLNTLRKVASTKDALGKAALVTCVGGEEKGQFARFSVDATFVLAGQAFLQQKTAQLGERNPLVRGLKADQKQFREEAFRNLTIYSGCELTPLLTKGGPDREAPTLVQDRLEKVIKINRDHCMRAAQSRAALEQGIISDIRRSHKGLPDYTDREVLAQAIREFEVGQIPQVADQQRYITQMTDLMMIENDLLQSSRIGRELQGLKRKLLKLEVDVHLIDKQTEVASYQARCQQWNLEMALLATRQKAINVRMESYSNQVLDTETLAMLSFERQVGTVLRPNQVQEVSEALRNITDSLENDKPMSRISHKGTGWGKSTVLQLLTDHASLLAKGRKDLSVLVVAPESNQAELDILLGRYYAKKGRTYHRLNMVEELKAHDPNDPATLDRVHNILLGLDPGTATAERGAGLANERAPVGVSIKDVQILMHLRNAYSANDASSELIQRMDAIMDLMRESMSFCDEWDSALVPHLKVDLEAMAEEINEALAKVQTGYRVTTDDIIRSHGEFVLGSRRKQLLSATTATPYTAAMASGSLHPEVIKTNCNTDPLTTNQRFWHWMCSATPVYYSSRNEKGRAELLDQVVDRVGVNRQVMVFDGQDSGQDVPASARKVHSELNDARSRRGGQARETLFYDKQKHLKKYQPDGQLDDQAEGLSVSDEEEAFLRATRGASVDVFLTQRESVGTDAPQGQRSAGVYLGLFQQGEEGREDLTAQQIGRLMRASNELRSQQTLFLGIDMDVLDQVREGAEKTAFTEARLKVQEEWKALEAQLPLKNGSHAQASCIYSPLSLTPPEPGSQPGAIELRLEQELDRLAETQWLQAGLSNKQIGALRKYKKAEWMTKKALLELTAVELARREATNHTIACEKLLSEARVNSCLEYEAAREDVWLKSTGVMTADTYKVPDAMISEYSDPRVCQEVEKRFRSYAQTGIQTIPRRKVEGATPVDGIPEFFDPERTKDLIRSNMEALRRNGLKAVGPDELAVEMESLKQESLARLTEVQGRIEKLIRILSETTCYGLQGLKRLRGDIERDITRVDQGNDEDTLAAESLIEQAYQKMFTGVLQVAIGQKSTSEAIRTKAFTDVERVMGEVFDAGALEFSTEQRAINRLDFKVTGTSRDGVTDKFTYRKTTKHNTKVVEPNPVYKLKESVLGDPGSEESLHARTSKLRANKDWRDKVQVFCANPKSPLFRGAVDNLEQLLLNSVDFYARQQKTRVDEEMSAMHQQEKMMQQRMMITVQ
ncbi:MAG: hypothetical protein ACR2PT_22300 [Endozoicomonas sp.]